MSKIASGNYVSKESLFIVQKVLLKEQKLDGKPQKYYFKVNFNTGFLEVLSMQHSVSFIGRIIKI